MIMLKVTKNQDFTLSLEDKFSEKPEGGGGGGGGGPNNPPAFSKLRHVKNPGKFTRILF